MGSKRPWTDSLVPPLLSPLRKPLEQPPPHKMHRGRRRFRADGPDGRRSDSGSCPVRSYFYCPGGRRTGLCVAAVGLGHRTPESPGTAWGTQAQTIGAAKNAAVFSLFHLCSSFVYVNDLFLLYNSSSACKYQGFMPPAQVRYKNRLPDGPQGPPQRRLFLLFLCHLTYGSLPVGGDRFIISAQGMIQFLIIGIHQKRSPGKGSQLCFLWPE